MHPALLLPLCILSVAGAFALVLFLGWLAFSGAQRLDDWLQARGVSRGTSELITTCALLSLILGAILWIAMVSP